MMRVGTETVIGRLRLDSHRRTAAIAMALGLVPAMWYVRTDLALYDGDWSHLAPRLIARLLMLVISVLALLLLRGASTTASYSRVVLGYAVCAAVFILLVNGMRPRGSILPLRTPLYTIPTMYAGLPNRFWRQCLPALALSAGLIVLRLTWVTGNASGDIPGDLLIVFMSNALGILLVHRRLTLEGHVGRSWRAEHEALLLAERSRAELQALRGIIPICAHCGRVRTELGNWQQLEIYVRAHSAAEFSRGVCPTCIDADLKDPRTEPGARSIVTHRA